MNRDQSIPPTGQVVAALYAVLIGLAVMLASHVWSVADPFHAPRYLLKLGSWIPGWWSIGPYAGKETAGLLGWLISWLMLHLLLRKRHSPLRPHFYAFLAGFLLLLVGYWPPVYHAVYGWPPAIP